MVKHSIPHGGFMNVAGFGIRYVECLIRRMPIRFCGQFSMQRNQTLHEVLLKFLYVFALPLSFAKLTPRQQEVF